MAAAYSALVSLLNTMENIQNHPRLSTYFDKKQTGSLSGIVDFLLDFIENYSHGGSKDSEDLERQIACAARGAEDVIESHIANQIKEIYGMLDLQKEIKDIEKVTEVNEKIQPKDEKSHIQKIMKDMDATKKKRMEVKEENMPDHLQKVIENMDSIKEKVTEVKEERALNVQQRKSPMREASSRPIISGKTAMVGFDSYLVKHLDWLTGQQFDRQIISITSMGGIGKTTLARNIYKNLLVLQHFDVLAWVTISQEFNVTEILQETLSCLRGSVGGMVLKKNEDELGEQLYKSLSGRRYLIILDDIWGVKAWDKIKIFFLDNCNRSRIIVTTRISSLADHFSSLGLALDLLDGDQSWKLFCQEVFGQEGCATELEKIGKEIVEKCKGLPLSISVIGGLLRKFSKTQQYWALSLSLSL